MVEILDLVTKILFIPIPLPFSFDGEILYYNLFGILVVTFLLFLCGYIIYKLSAGAGD